MRWQNKWGNVKRLSLKNADPYGGGEVRNGDILLGDDLNG